MTEDATLPSTDGAVRLGLTEVSETPSVAGKNFRTNWFQVDAEKLPLFDQATYTATNAHEVDEDAYPDDLIEGYHLISLLDYLVNDVLFVDGSWVAWNYGMNKVRFVHPTRASDRWRVHGEVVDVTERSDGYLLTLAMRSEIEGVEKPGFIVEQLVLWRTGASA
jgi:hypothetical protein